MAVAHVVIVLCVDVDISVVVIVVGIRIRISVDIDDIIFFFFCISSSITMIVKQQSPSIRNMPRILHPIQDNARLIRQHTPHPVLLAQRRVARGSGLACGAARGHEQAEGLCGGREIEFAGDDFKEFGDAGAGVTEEFDAGVCGCCGGCVWIVVVVMVVEGVGLAGRRKVYARVFPADLEGEFSGGVVDKGTGVVDEPGRYWWCCTRGVGVAVIVGCAARLGSNADAAFEDIL